MAEDFESACMNIDLKEIEPFTLVVVSWKEKLGLSEFIWDGNQRHFKNLTPGPHIWSSSTLYDDEMKGMRLNWFEEWLDTNSISKESILDFHKTAGIGSPEIDVFMKREKVGTVSITQVLKNQELVEMDYEAFD